LPGLLIIGATGALGRDVVTDALGRGFEAAGLVRNPTGAALPDQLELIRGDVLDAASVKSALAGRDTVICALGTPSPRKRSTLMADGTANLIAAMRGQGVRRLVCVTLLGCGPSRANCSLIYGRVILRALAPMMPDKEAQEQAVRASNLDWLLVRPPRFTGDKARGQLRVLRDGEPGRLGHVIRADLAHFLVDCATRPDEHHQALAVGS
jgi:uncharacterized protein YbjT (DUF2867 family)